MSRSKGKGKAVAKSKPSPKAAVMAAAKVNTKKNKVHKSTAAAAAADTSGSGTATRAVNDVPTSSMRSTALPESSSADAESSGESGSSGDASSGNFSGNQGTTISANSAESARIQTRARKRTSTLKSSDTEAEMPAKRLWFLDPALAEDFANADNDTTEDKSDKTSEAEDNKNKKEKDGKDKGNKDKGKGKATHGDSDAYARFAASASGPFATELEELEELDDGDDEMHWPRVPEHLREAVSSELSGEGGRGEPPTTPDTDTRLRPAIINQIDESGTRATRPPETQPTNTAKTTNDVGEDSPYWHRALPAPIPTGPRGAPALWPGPNRGDRDVPSPVPGGHLAPLAPPHPNLRNGFTFSPPRRAYTQERFEGDRRMNHFWSESGVYARDYAYADRRPRHFPQAQAQGPRGQVASNMHAGPAAIGHGHDQRQRAVQRFRDDFGNVPAGVVNPPAAGGAAGDVAPFVGGVGSSAPQPHTPGFTGGFGGYADGYSFGLARAPPAAERPANAGYGFVGLAGPNRVDRHPAPNQQPLTMVVEDVDQPQQQQPQPETEIVEVEDDELDTSSESGSIIMMDDNYKDKNDKDDPPAGGAGGSGTGNSGNSGNSGSGSGKRYDYSSSEDGNTGGQSGTNNTGYERACAGDQVIDADIVGSAAPRAISPAPASDISDISDFLLPWMKPDPVPKTEIKPLQAGEKYLALMTAHPLPDGASQELKQRYGAWLDATCQAPRPVPHRAPQFLGDAASKASTSATTASGNNEDSDAIAVAVMQQAPMTLGMEAQLLATLGKLPRYDEYPTSTELAAAIVHHDIIARRRSERLKKPQADQNEAAKLLLGLRRGVDDMASTDDADDVTVKGNESEAEGSEVSETEAESESEAESKSDVAVTDAEHWQAKPRYRSPSVSFGSATHAAQLRAALAGHDPAAVLKRLKRHHTYLRARADVFVPEYPNFPGAWRVPTRGELVAARKARRAEERKLAAKERREKRKAEIAEKKMKEKAEKEKESEGKGKRGRKRKVPEPATLPKLRLTYKRAKVAE